MKNIQELIEHLENWNYHSESYFVKSFSLQLKMWQSVGLISEDARLKIEEYLVDYYKD